MVQSEAYYYVVSIYCRHYRNFIVFIIKKITDRGGRCEMPFCNEGMEEQTPFTLTRNLRCSENELMNLNIFGPTFHL